MYVIGQVSMSREFNFTIYYQRVKQSVIFSLSLIDFLSIRTMRSQINVMQVNSTLEYLSSFFFNKL